MARKPGAMGGLIYMLKLEERGGKMRKRKMKLTGAAKPFSS